MKRQGWVKKAAMSEEGRDGSGGQRWVGRAKMGEEEKDG